MNQMYTTGGLVFQNILGQNMMPCQNLFAYQDLFLYEYARYLLHKKLVTEGLLSLYAGPFPHQRIRYKEKRKEKIPTNQTNI